MQKDWFEEWFDSPYYHILYRHRDDNEARYFIDNLLAHLDLPKGSRVLDLACGRGRHSVYLNRKGYDVTGLDLSPANIRYARQFENPTLRFDVHDMREVYSKKAYDCIFNLFTSFGYFGEMEENTRVICSMAEMLLPGGRVVLDYLNAASLVVEETPVESRIGDVEFRFRKKREKDFILKYITVLHNGEEFRYMERVRIFSPEDFREMFRTAGLHIETIAGDYDLRTFDPAVSERMIILAKKA